MPFKLSLYENLNFFQNMSIKLAENAAFHVHGFQHNVPSFFLLDFSLKKRCISAGSKLHN